MAGNDSFSLTGVTVTDQVLGHGSYATVLELQYKGLKCAGKKIHEVLLRQGASSYSVRRFEEECRLLSQVRHPNIVQFLGFCYESGVELPILVMEYLPTTLAASIENYGVMPTDINYAVLHDVAVGLYYLHSQPRPIIHRDLSSNNVLLTRDMKAKISDLGVARILDVSPLNISRMTQTPGTAAFMPPEVMTANPTYDTSIDEFAFGVLMIHVLSGQWPAPQTGTTRTNEDGTVSLITEAERRENFLETIGSDHPLMGLILRCIHNNPNQRAHAEELVQQLAEVTSPFPSSNTTRLETQKKMEVCERKAKELDLTCSIQREQLQIQNEELTNTRETATSLTRLLQQKDDTITRLSGQLNRVTTFLATNRQTLSTCLTWKQCRDTPRESSIEQCTVIQGKVYFTAQGASTESDRCVVYCYDTSKDTWATLPPLPVQWYGLGQLNGKLVAIGGKKRDGAPERSNKVYTFNESLQEWTVTVPNMPTERGGPAVISLPSALVVAGGYATSGYIDTVEIFKLDTYQWYVTDPLPIACSNMAAYSTSNDTCYLLGGYRPASCINNVFSASIDDLLRNARAVTVSATSNTDNVCSNRDQDQESTGSIGSTGSAWKTLPSTPNYQPTVATVLTDTLIAMGGWDTSQGRVAKTELYLYSHSTSSWVHVGDLPAPRAVTTATALSPTELLVIGGWDGSERVKTVYRGTLTITM